MIPVMISTGQLLNSYISTGKETYLDYLVGNPQPYMHQITNSWMFFIRNMGFHTLLINMDQFKDERALELAWYLKEQHLALSDEILEKMNSIPYSISIDHFEWGSNSDVLNQAMILCIAHHITGDQKYLDGAIRNTDYIFGKNATGFSFLTGFGSKQVMNPHHRPSGADGWKLPFPASSWADPTRTSRTGQLWSTRPISRPKPLRMWNPALPPTRYVSTGMPRQYLYWVTWKKSINRISSCLASVSFTAP